jgi:hypothetical protein
MVVVLVVFWGCSLTTPFYTRGLAISLMSSSNQLSKPSVDCSKAILKPVSLAKNILLRTFNNRTKRCEECTSRHPLGAKKLMNPLRSFYRFNLIWQLRGNSVATPQGDGRISEIISDHTVSDL